MEERKSRSADSRNTNYGIRQGDIKFVRKAVNWALRNIGKRNANLNTAAIETAERIRSSSAGRWIATEALRELKSQAVQSRLRRKVET